MQNHVLYQRSVCDAVPALLAEGLSGQQYFLLSKALCVPEESSALRVSYTYLRINKMILPGDTKK